MRIIVVGCGKVGNTIVEQLSQENHDIAVIDANSQVITNVTNRFDVIGLVGNGASYSVQKEAGVEEADLLIAATDSDELNLLCCLIAKKAGGCNTIARVRNPVYNSEIGFIREELGLSLTVNPEFAAATEAARILRFPSAIKIDTFVGGRVEIMKLDIPAGSILDNCKMSEISRRVRAEVLVCAVERGKDTVIPNGQFVLHAGDTISIVASRENTRNFVERIGLNSHRVRDCMIIGGGTIAYYLAKQLLAEGIEVKIIEKDRDRCEELCDMLPRATIIHGDASHEETLAEEGIAKADSVVTLTGIDEANIFLSLYARSVSDAKVITKINHLSFDEVIDRFRLGSLIHPRNITAEYILRYVRAMQNSIGSNVEALYNLIEDKVEALEFSIHTKSAVCGIPLKDLNTKPNVLIACISRGGKTIIPNGHATIEVGDHVIIITTEIGFQDISDILQN